VVFVFHLSNPLLGYLRSSRYEATANTTNIPVATVSETMMRIPMSLPFDTSSWLWWSNAVLIVGAVLALWTSATVLYEKRQAGKGIEIRHSVRNEVLFVAAAIVCLAGTCGSIYFGAPEERTIRNTEQAANSLKQFTDVMVFIDCNGLNQESLKFRQQIEDILTEAHVNHKRGVWIGSSVTEGDPNIQILHKDEPRANEFGAALKAIFDASQVDSSQGPPDPRDDSSPIAMADLDPQGLPFIRVHVGPMRRRH
jgi:hypothetical protein